MVLEMLFTQLLLNKSRNTIINTMLAETSLSVVQEIFLERLWQLKLRIILAHFLLSESVKPPTVISHYSLLLLSIKETIRCSTLLLLLLLKHPAGTILTTLLCNTSKESSENIVVISSPENTWTQLISNTILSIPILVTTPTWSCINLSTLLTQTLVFSVTSSTVMRCTPLRWQLLLKIKCQSTLNT